MNRYYTNFTLHGIMIAISFHAESRASEEQLNKLGESIANAFGGDFMYVEAAEM